MSEKVSDRPYPIQLQAPQTSSLCIVQRILFANTTRITGDKKLDVDA
jgi:hypothetical protein